MRNTKTILMSLLMIGVVATAVGATLADFSDIEVSQDNYFNTGSMDLLVSDSTGQWWNGPGVIPALFTVSDAWPCCSKDFRFDLHNDGQGYQEVPWVYIHFKNLECYGIERVEPEIAVEDGGIIGELADGTIVYSPGIGVYGENCELAEHIDIAIYTGTTGIGGPFPNYIDLIAMGYDKNGDGVIKMNEIECEQIELGELPDCEPLYVMVTLHLQDVPEEYLGYDLFPGTDSKWNDWVTNALMKDGMEFDIAFELLQNPVVP